MRGSSQEQSTINQTSRAGGGKEGKALIPHTRQTKGVAGRGA